MNTKLNKLLQNKKIIYYLIGMALLLWLWRCPFRLLGYSCPGCGMSRALWAVIHLDFTKAFSYHPLWPVVVVVALYLLIKYFFDKGFSEKTERNIFIVIMMIFIGVFLYRLLVLDDPIVRFAAWQ